jgi:hypothetical protein
VVGDGRRRGGRAGGARLRSGVAVAVAVWPCVQAAAAVPARVSGGAVPVRVCAADPTETTSLWTGRRRRALELGCCCC